MTSLIITTGMNYDLMLEETLASLFRSEKCILKLSPTSKNTT
jgi:hypothetical protein